MTNASSPAAAHFLRPQILDRRARLQTAARSMPAHYVQELLAEIDSALARIDQGTFGICETCHDPIEADRLQADPLLRFCLDHLSRKERQAHEEDMELAARVQSNLLPPTSVATQSWRAHFIYRPAGPVGGDYCDLSASPDGRELHFAVGDVSGKGVASGLLMTHLHAIFRSLLPLNLPIADALSRANRLFCEATLTSHYATLAYCHAVGDQIQIANAGHCPPLIIRRHSVAPVAASGLPIGLFCSAEYSPHSVVLEAGDSLVLYSDGITESRNPNGDEFGEERLAAILEANASLEPGPLTELVLKEVTAFRNGVPPADDLTLLVVQRSR